MEAARPLKLAAHRVVIEKGSLPKLTHSEQQSIINGTRFWYILHKVRPHIGQTNHLQPSG